MGEEKKETMDAALRRFTYGDQFSPQDFQLSDLVGMIASAGSDRYRLQKVIQNTYWTKTGRSDDNTKKLAMNTVLSLSAYRFIETDVTGRVFKLTNFFNSLAAALNSNSNSETTLRKILARHILVELEGLTLLRVIESMLLRGEQVTLEAINLMLSRLDIEIAPNCTYVSTMKAWLDAAGVFHDARNYNINWDNVEKLIELDKDDLSRLYKLTDDQLFYLRGAALLGAKDWTKASKISDYVRDTFGHHITTKMLVNEVLNPLVELNLIEAAKTTTGRGAKPHNVKLTSKFYSDHADSILAELLRIERQEITKLNRPLSFIKEDLKSDDKHIKGLALEELAMWMIRLLGLKFVKWRMRSEESTGGGEVDVMAESHHLVFSRWQIQCKNTSSIIGVDVVAKEAGLTFITNADIVLIITTSTFSKDAIIFVQRLMTNSRYYVVLLDGTDVAQICDSPSDISTILNRKAKRVYLTKKYGVDKVLDIKPYDEPVEEE